MLSSSTSRLLARAVPRFSNSVPSSARLFSSSIRRMAEGDTGDGSSRPGGAAQGDAFSKREKANEDQYVRQQELMKQKLRDAKKNVQDLDKDLQRQIEEIEREGAGKGGDQK